MFVSGAAALENITDNCSRPARESAYIELDWLRINSTVKRQRGCLAFGTGDSVSVRLSAVGVGFAGVARCGRQCCPVCGPKIAAVRRDEITRAVRQWVSEGGTVYFGTLTVRHNLGQGLGHLWDALHAGWVAARGGRGWMTDRAAYGIEHVLRVTEVKYGMTNGWHPHNHFLLFISGEPHGSTTPAGVVSASVVPSRRLQPVHEAQGGDIAGLLRSIHTRHAAAVKRRGMSAPLLRAQDLHRVTGDNVAEHLGDYFAKEARPTSAESMGWELSNADGKASGDSFTPAEIRSLAVGGDPDAESWWAEYEQAAQARRNISWSKGMRAYFGLDEELTDESIVDEEAGTVEDTVLSISSRSFAKLARTPGHRFIVLNLVQKRGGDAALAWLTRSGYVAMLGSWVPVE